MGESSRGATREDLENFISANKRWIPDDAETMLRSMSAVDQRRVIAAGTMSSVRDPSAVIQTRARKARALENDPVPTANGAEDPAKFNKPATRDELETFILQNKAWLSADAERTLRNLNPPDWKRVIAGGTMSSVRDPVAVIQTRIRKARQLEAEVIALSKPKPTAEPPSTDSVPSLQPTAVFSSQMVEAHLFAPPEVVDRSSSKFQPFVPGATLAKEDESSLVGDVKGIGGVIEVLKPKFGFARGQRARVIGEKPGILQFEGGKTVPKHAEGAAWKWMMRCDLAAEGGENANVQEAHANLRRPRSRSPRPDEAGKGFRKSASRSRSSASSKANGSSKRKKARSSGASTKDAKSSDEEDGRESSEEQEDGASSEESSGSGADESNSSVSCPKKGKSKKRSSSEDSLGRRKRQPLAKKGKKAKELMPPPKKGKKVKPKKGKKVKESSSSDLASTEESTSPEPVRKKKRKKK